MIEIPDGIKHTKIKYVCERANESGREMGWSMERGEGKREK